jgi:rhodanese-related sulfurtransferase
MDLHSYITSGIGNKIGEILHLTPREAITAFGLGAVLLDVREEFEIGYIAYDVTSILYFPASKFEEYISELPRDKFYIVADAVGIHSKEVCLKLLNIGFTSFANLAGGIVEWERDGFPVIINPKEQLSGSCVCQLKARNKKS